MMKLVICETVVSTWDYHLRMVEEGKEKYGGGAGIALCGVKLGWDTYIPLSEYGEKDSHIPVHWCKECLKLARISNLPGVEKITKRTALI